MNLKRIIREEINNDLLMEGKLNNMFKKFNMVHIKKELKESDDEWEWARKTQPIELENPKDWVGRSFGYGQEIIDNMNDNEIDASYDEEYFTITGIDENGNLTLIKHHPIYGESHDSTTSPRNLRDYINKGSWVWM